MSNSVILGMSGGIDSSVSAYLLKSMGYKVIGVTISMFESDALKRAQKAAQTLGIEHISINRQESFKKEVIDNIKSVYLSGRTPNPCVRCNRVVKFESLMDVLKKRSADYISTGHYSRIVNYSLNIGTDLDKDQSYFLYNIKRDYLGKIIFPLGDKSKDTVRQIAKEIGLDFQGVKESSDLCFLQNGKNYRSILDVKDRPGKILDVDGNIIGSHLGVYNYTIGQRKGVGVSSSGPLYVKAIDALSNTITLADKESLKAKMLYLKEINLLTDVNASLPNIMVKVRYRSHLIKARANFASDFSSCVIELLSDCYAPAPGQSCVIYQGETVLGGGVIDYYE